MREKEINEEYEFKVKGIHCLPVGGIVTDVYMDLEKVETTVKISVRMSIIKKEAKK